MPLRCLLFSSNEEMVQPIWQVLTDLGIEGEYCPSAVDAVERVTTQLFQIVITDWEDQPEAAFLLKTARDIKAAQRPLTLAIVSDDARLPEALQAGANSVLLKPIRIEQVRDTMSTACELLRAKQPAAPQQPAIAAGAPEVTPSAALAAAAGAISGAAMVSVTPASVTQASAAPASVTQTPEKAFRAGEFLQSPGSAPGAQFDTESEVQKSLDQAAAGEVDALTELEPMASAVVAPEPAEPQTALTGWASLQERLTKSAPPKPVEPSGNELLSYGETTSYGAPPAAVENKNSEVKQSPRETGQEAALYAYMSGESTEEAGAAETVRPKNGKIFLLAMLAVACVLIAVPRARQRLRIFSGKATVAGKNWLNPQPVPVPQAATQHETFGQEGDEYKFPVAANIPDATTDPSQIRVLPVVDPTAKPVKGSETNGTPTTAESASSDQGQSASASGDSTPAPQVTENPVKEQTSTSVGNAAADPGTVSPSGLPPTIQTPAQPVAPVTARQDPPHIAPPVQAPAPPREVPAVRSAAIPSSAIPSSLKSQVASMTPEASGAKPAEAAMSSIEPVSLPETAVWELLTQKVDPVYPDSAKAGGQTGRVVLQVLIGRDGAVQDAKFLQGSLVFARAAIDAVKQWQFKPYSMNGRAVSVQSTITLNFKPPA
jgi:TonB family protein